MASLDIVSKAGACGNRETTAATRKARSLPACSHKLKLFDLAGASSLDHKCLTHYDLASPNFYASHAFTAVITSSSYLQLFNFLNDLGSPCTSAIHSLEIRYELSAAEQNLCRQFCRLSGEVCVVFKEQLKMLDYGFHRVVTEGMAAIFDTTGLRAEAVYADRTHVVQSSLQCPWTLTMEQALTRLQLRWSRIIDDMKDAGDNGMIELLRRSQWDMQK